MSDIKHVCKKSDFPFAAGNVKKAYEVKDCIDFESDKDTTQMVIVNFGDKIRWINPSKRSNRWQPTRNGNKIIEFKTKMMNDPDFTYNNSKLIDKLMTDHPDWETTKKSIEVSIEEFPEIKNLEDLLEWYQKNNSQFYYINELKKMNELSKAGLAPKLYQIRINAEAPFSPEEIDAKMGEIPDGENPIQISYLAEKCGGDISTFIRRIESDMKLSYDKKKENIEKIIQKICDFCDAFVDTTESVNCDLKDVNLCPNVVEGEIVSIMLLDVDPMYSIEKKGNPDFLRHAKVFMKFLIFMYLLKKTENNYELRLSKVWKISNVEVREMISFFYGMEYMKYQFNPINMMYHYLIKKHPVSKDERSYDFLKFDELKQYFTTDAEMIEAFRQFIGIMKGGKKPKSRRVSRKGKRGKSRKVNKS
jgi:hypothetical protein